MLIQIKLLGLRFGCPSLLSGIFIKAKQIRNGSAEIQRLAVNPPRLEITRISPALDVGQSGRRNAVADLLEHLIRCQRKIVPRPSQNLQLNRGFTGDWSFAVGNLPAQLLLGFANAP